MKLVAFSKLSCVALLLAVSSVPGIGASSSPHDVPAGFPVLELPSILNGERAIAGLGRQLPQVAAFYRMTEAQLKAQLRRDKDLMVDPRGRLLYVCNWGPVPETEPEPSAELQFQSIDEADAFRLHSLPGSGKKIFLDFDGFDASGTSWGSDAIGVPFDTDGVPYSFSSAERTRIINIWKRVAEDYAMFDVDVTTEDPGTDALRKSNSSDTNYGIRVVIGGSSSDWYGNSAGGVAYVGSFSWSSDTPCWVFPKSLSNSEKNIAEAASHEAGHTVGLSHDGEPGGDGEYYRGHGNWAPIMGVGYYEPVTQWSKGEYQSANNLEDDLVKIQQYGPAYRPDDHGNSISSATPMQGVSFSLFGNIERSTDVDFFSFETGGGPATFTVTPVPAGPNLHVLLSLYNSSGGLVASANPADTTAGVQPATISTVLSLGAYYLSVDGVGSGDPLTTGYSDYASLGEYEVSGSVPSGSGWIASAPGSTYSYLDSVNWSSAVIPLGRDALARINNNIAGNQTIRLNRSVSLGALVIGDADSLHSFTLQDGVGGSLRFNSASGPAWIAKLAGSRDFIESSVFLDSDTVVTNASPNALVFIGAINGAGMLRKEGSGLVQLDGINPYTGRTVVSSGTLALGATASIANSPEIEVKSPALLDVSAIAAGFHVGAGRALRGNGAVAGDVLVSSGGRIAPGPAGSAGTLIFSNNLALTTGAILELDLGTNTVPGSGSNDLIVIKGNLDLSGTVLVDFNFPDRLPAIPGNYKILTCDGAIVGTMANLSALNESTRYAFAFDDSVPGEIRVQVSGSPATIVWNQNGVSGQWDALATSNWLNSGTPDSFRQLDSVVFSDTSSPALQVSLVGSLQPSTVLVDSTRNYVLGGSGRISGTASLVKTGTGILTINNGNDFSGVTEINSGTLKIGNPSALGTLSDITVNGTGALDMNALALAPKSLVIQGSGPDGSGALINSSSSPQTTALPSLALSGPAAIGGLGRWDLRASPASTLAGNNYSLTKTGPNEIWLAEAGSTGLGDISIVQGLLGFEGSTTLGDPARTITVSSNACIGLHNTDQNVLSKAMILNSGGIDNRSGNNSFSGTIGLNGSNYISTASPLVLMGAISGTGSLTKLGSAALSLTTANPYTGETIVSAGTLQTYNGSALGNAGAGTTIAANARLDLMGSNLGAETITVQGDGLGNAGAIVNSGSSQLNALRFVILSGNTTLGGLNRWDIRANPTGNLTGNNYALTKVGKNEIWFADVGQTGLGTVSVKEGLLGFRGNTTMGNASAAITVGSTATLGFYSNEANILIKPLTLTSGRIYNGSGANTFAGPTTMSGSNRFDVASGSKLTMSGVLSGSGSLHAGSTGALILTANNTYSGTTRVLSGTLQFGNGGSSGLPGTGSITNSATLVFSRNNAVTVPNLIAGTGALHHGAVNLLNPHVGSTLFLPNTNFYSGDTIVYGNGNLLAVGTDASLGTGRLLFNGNNNGNSVAGIRSANAFTRTIPNAMVFGSGGSVQFGTVGTGDLVFAGPTVTTDTADKTLLVSNSLTTIYSSIGNNSRLIKDGPGTLALAGINTNAGWVINLGTLRVDDQTRLGRNPATFMPTHLTLNGGVLQTTASFALNDSNRGVSLGANGGTFNVNPATTLTIDRPISGTGALRKSGLGALVLTAQNTYSGATTNFAGTLLINGKIEGARLQVVSGILGGTGTVRAPVEVLTGATLAPGASMGTLTISNSLVLAGVTLMEVNPTSHSNDQVRGVSTITYGGNLTISNLGGSFANGDTFKLFDAVSYGGQFENVQPQQPGPGLIWDLSRLNVNGTLSVVAPVPAFDPPSIINGALTLNGCGGEPGAAYSLLSTTNVALPYTAWDVLTTGIFDPLGCFSITNSLDPLLPLRFYILKTP